VHKHQQFAEGFDGGRLPDVNIPGDSHFSLGNTKDVVRLFQEHPAADPPAALDPLML
jgi:hypothetical protein